MSNTKDQSKAFAVVWATLIKKGLHHRQIFWRLLLKKIKPIPSRVKNCQTFWNFPFIILLEKKVTTKSLTDKFNLFRSVNLFSEIYWPKNKKGNILLCLMSPWFQSVRSNNGLLPIALYCLHREQHNEIYLWVLHKWSYWFS